MQNPPPNEPTESQDQVSEHSETLPPPPRPEGEAPSTDAPTPDGVSRFDLIRRIAEGGEGEIWEAEQRPLGRIIALKTVRHIEGAEGASLRDHSRRLLMEGRIGAALEHPNILPFHDLASDADGTPILAMKRVHGETWERLLELERESMDAEEFLERHLGILADVCQAIAFAHSRGIIHRDIKPAQVMLGAFGETLLMDWGLAVSLDPDRLPPEWQPEMTPVPPTIGETMNPSGSPAFMAPEQTGESVEGLGPWTDVYLLASTLFLILTGTPPHMGESVAARLAKAGANDIGEIAARLPEDLPEGLGELVLHAMRTDGPARPRATEFLARLQEIRAGHPRRRRSRELIGEVEEQLPGARSYVEMNRLLARIDAAAALWESNPAIARHRARTYARYAQLALDNNDLALARQHLAALPPSAERDRLQAQANKKSARARRRDLQRRLAFGGVLVLAVAAGLTAMVAMSQKKRADDQLVQTEEAVVQARSMAATAHRAQARAEREQYYAGIALAASHLDDAELDTALHTLMERTPLNLRNWEWGALMGRVAPDDMTLTSGDNEQGRAVFHAAFSPDGTQIATGHQAGHIILWDAASGRMLQDWQYPDIRGFWGLAWDSAGERITASSLNGVAVVIDTRTGEELTRVAAPESQPVRVFRGTDFSPDGSRFVTTGHSQEIQIRHTGTGEILRAVPLPAVTYDAAWSPDGEYIAAALLSEPGLAVIMKAGTGEVVHTFDDQKLAVLSVRFSPDGQRLLTAGNDGTARVYDIASGRLLLEMPTTDARLRCAEFSFDGSLVAAAGNDAFLYIWDALTGELLVRHAADRRMEKIAFAPDSLRLVTLSFNAVRIWDAEELLARTVEVPVPPAHAARQWERLQAPSFPRARQDFWVGYDTWTGKGIGRQALRRGSNEVLVDSWYTHFSPDQSVRFSIDEETGEGQVFSGNTETPVTPVLLREVYTAAFSPDGATLAASDYRGHIHFFDTLTWEKTSEWRHQKRPAHIATALEWSPDGSLLGIGHMMGAVTLLDPVTKEIAADLPDAHAKLIVRLRFSPDGTRFVTASSDESARVSRTVDGSLLSVFRGHGHLILDADFTNDGTRVMTVGMDNKARLFDPLTGRETLTLLDVSAEKSLVTGRFSRDGSTAFFATADGTLYTVPTFGWEPDQWPCGETMEMARCLELVKRRNRVSEAISAADIDWP